MTRNDSSSDYPSLETTRSEKRKARVVYRCVVNILKFMRLCKGKKGIKDKPRVDNKNERAKTSA